MLVRKVSHDGFDRVPKRAKRRKASMAISCLITALVVWRRPDKDRNLLSVSRKTGLEQFERLSLWFSQAVADE